MKYKLYTTSQSAWDGMFKAMLSAEQTIYLEMYIFLADTENTHNFLKLLIDKARAGLEVVIIADSYGSAHLDKGAVSELRAAGAEFIYFSHWFKHTHRKILIIDQKVAFIGGVNIEEKTRRWRDLQIKLSGRIIKPLLKSFAYGYEIAGGRRESVIKFSRRSLSKKIKSWIIDNLPATTKKYRLNNYYHKRVAQAKKSVIIVTPYLLPPRWLMVLLDEACRRGVKVDILIPNDTDVKPLNKVNFLNACRLFDLGVNFYLMPVMNHAKIMLIDESEGVIGSQNMDVLSFNWNIEAGVFFSQKKLVADLLRIVEHWKKESLVFENAGRRVKGFDKVLMIILKFFYPIF